MKAIPGERCAKLMERLLLEKPTVDELVTEVALDPDLIPLFLEIIRTDKGTVKFFADKVLRALSEGHPQLVYPYFDRIANFLDSTNNFIKWGAIVTISNLIVVDDEGKFLKIHEKYFSLLDDKAMITAANVAGNAWKFVKEKPQLEQDITRRLLKTADNTYINKGKPSPECKNIMMGHVIDCFDRYFEKSSSQERIIGFCECQRENSRRAVARKAEAFLKKHKAGTVVKHG